MNFIDKKNLINIYSYMSKCAPGKNFKDGSCFTKKDLTNITLALNEQTDNKIDTNLSKKDLVEKLENTFKKEFGCKDQKCWLGQKFIKKMKNDSLEKFTFRPDGPKGKHTWLSTTNINDVIQQYENNYDDFMFLGTVPYDFEDLEELGISNLNFKNEQKDGISKLGMVINLDYHYQSGSHWVALYTDLDKNQIYYFDSFAKPPRKKIKNYINKITKYIYKKKYGEKLDINEVLEQIGGKNVKKSKQISNLKSFDIRYNNIIFCKCIKRFSHRPKCFFN